VARICTQFYPATRPVRFATVQLYQPPAPKPFWLPCWGSTPGLVVTQQAHHPHEEFVCGDVRITGTWFKHPRVKMGACAGKVTAYVVAADAARVAHCPL
jgi:hypothetical protein